MARKKILVADDSLTIQKVIRLALSNEGYEIQAVSDGNDAIEQISVYRPHVVLIDISLPGKTAFEVKRTINTHSDLQDVQFVLLSSAFEKVDEAQAGELRFQDRLTKPFDPAQLRQILTRLLQTQPISPPSERWSSELTQPTGSIPQAPETTDPLMSLPEPPGSESPLPSAPPTSPFEIDFSGSDDLPPPLPEWKPIDIPETPIHTQPSIPPFHFEELPEHGFSTHLPPHSPPPPPRSDDDIRQLTRETFEAQDEPPSTSHLDSVDESSDSIDSLDSSGTSPSDDFEWSINEPTLKPPAGFFDDSQVAPKIQLGQPAGGVSPSQYYQKNTIHPVQPPEPAQPTSELEQVIRKQVQETLQKMAKDWIPDLAEKIIKQEIHKMLSDQPTLRSDGRSEGPSAESR